MSVREVLDEIQNDSDSDIEGSESECESDSDDDLDSNFEGSSGENEGNSDSISLLLQFPVKWLACGYRIIDTCVALEGLILPILPTSCLPTPDKMVTSGEPCYDGKI